MSGKVYTLAELRQYNGGGPDKRILVAVNGHVYDVTEQGKSFYSADGPYASLAGRDASRALATMNMEKVQDDPDDLSDLDPKDLDSLLMWDRRFKQKYECVGTLAKS